MVLAVFGSAGLASGQVVADCTHCDMRPELVVELGTEDGPGALGEPSHVVQRVNGQWAVTDFQGRGQVWIFAADGSFVRTIGRKGQGPGEYELPLWLHVLPGDSLEVVDFENLRITTLAPDLSVARTRRLGPAGLMIAFLPDGSHVLSVSIPSAMSIGLPLHLISREGRILRSFGAKPPVEEVRNQSRMRRALAPAGAHAVWSAELLRYVIEKWDVQGNRLQRMERKASWFPPQTHYGVRADPSIAPAPGLLYVHTDARGRVWTAANVPDPDWESAFVNGTDPYGRVARLVKDLNKYYDSIVEVIDPVSMQVVGRARFDESAHPFAGDGLYVTHETRGRGWPVVAVWRLRPPE